MTRPLNLLLIEDNVADAELVLREVCRSAFAPTWRRVETEADFLSALDPALDVILADYRMPRFDALRGLELLRERDLDTPFIIVSGAIGEEIAVEAMILGASDYVLKDRLGRLGQAIARALERSRLRAENRAAATALRESELRYRTLIEQAADGIIVADSEGRIVTVNSRVCAMLGYAAEELRGRAMIDFIDPEELAARPLRVEQLRAGVAVLNERLLLRKDGVRLPTETNSTLHGDGRIQVVVRDITERKQSETAIAELAAVVASATDAISGADRDGRSTVWNRGAEQLYGYTAEEILGHSVNLIVPEDQQDENERARAQIFAGAPNVRFETVRRRKDGSLVDVAMTVSPMHDAAGQVSGTSAISHDITERKRAEEALRVQTERLQILVESSRALQTASLDVQTVIDTITRQVATTIGDGCLILLLAEDGETFDRGAVWHADPDALDSLQMNLAAGTPSPVSNWVEMGIGSRESLLGAGTDSESVVDQAQPRFRDFVLGHGVHSWLSVPIWAHETVIGGMLVMRTRGGQRLTRDDKTLIEDLALRAAMAIENARLYGSALDAVRARDESLALLDTLVSAAPVGVSFVDTDRRYVRVNEALARMHGVPIEAHLGQTVVEVMGEESSVLLPIYERVLTTGDPVISVELSGLTPGPPESMSHWLGSYYRVEAGERVLGVGAVIIDITAQKRTEAALLKSEELYRTLAHNFPNGYVILFDRDCRAQIADGEALTDFGLTREMVEGRTVQEALPEGLSRQLEPSLQAALAGAQSTFEMETETATYLVHVLPVRDREGLIFGGLTVGQDITERNRFERQLEQQMFYDALTGLPNRALFQNRLEHALARAAREGTSVAVLALDLDRFQAINDSFGPLTGDTALAAVVERLKSSLRSIDTIARMTGDEFVVLIEEVREPSVPLEIATHIIQALRAPFSIADTEVLITTSIGIAIGAPIAGAPIDLLRDATAALYRAKAGGAAGSRSLT